MPPSPDTPPDAKPLAEAADDVYHHATSADSLRKILESGKLKSVRHLALENPEATLDVEHALLPFVRSKLPAEEALERMSKGGKTPDAIFLNRGGRYTPSYGEYVVRKRLNRYVQPHTKLTSIPDEYVTRRALSVRNNADVFVPSAELAAWREEFPQYAKRLQAIEDSGLAKITATDRVRTLGERITKRAEVEPVGLEAESRSVSPEAIRRLISRNALQVGSGPLGLALDDSDVDIFVPYARRRAYEQALERAASMFPELKPNAASASKEDKTTLTGRIGDKDVDLVLAYGERPRAFRDAYETIQRELTPEERERILDKKRKLKGAVILPEYRYRRYKKRLADDLGLAQHYF